MDGGAQVTQGRGRKEGRGIREFEEEGKREGEQRRGGSFGLRIGTRDALWLLGWETTSALYSNEPFQPPSTEGYKFKSPGVVGGAVWLKRFRPWIMT